MIPRLECTFYNMDPLDEFEVDGITGYIFYHRNSNSYILDIVYDEKVKSTYVYGNHHRAVDDMLDMLENTCMLILKEFQR